jgi:ankyrin repeat protein
MDDLHALIEAGDLDGLAAALKSSSGQIDSFQPCNQLVAAINRHGLKGTPLHLAVAMKNVDAVKLLLDNGADQSLRVIQSERGDEMIPYATASYLAGKLGYEQIAGALKNNLPQP